MKKFRHVVVGGTFDHIHRGHEVLLTKAFEVGKLVTIGLTTDTYVRENKNSKLISPACTCLRQEPMAGRQNNGLKIGEYEVRKRHLLQWLDCNGYLRRASVLPIDDPWGPLLTKDFPIDAIVVSVETHGRADELNRMREKVGLPTLQIIEIPVIINRNDDIHVSSTNVREGVMDTKGNLLLPQQFRKLMHEPFGPILADNEADAIIKNDHDALVIAVGDRTTQRVLSLGIHPRLSVIDLQVERKKVDWDTSVFDRLIHGSAVHELVSGPGYVSRMACDVIKEWVEEKCPRTVVIIDGEEDLLVLPILIEAPVGSILFYGQPKKGIVRVVVDGSVKAKAIEYLGYFQR
jgi:cytidyltransferase-like protein